MRASKFTAIKMVFFCFLCLFALQSVPTMAQSAAPPLKYLPLGDSYTIGEGVEARLNFPSQLAAALSAAGILVSIVDNPARTGYTTADLIRHELPLVHHHRPHCVTLLIGVNDWVQGVSEATFAANLEQIIGEVLTAMAPPGRLLLITIPDFSFTPQGAGYARGRIISAGLARFNALIKAAGLKHGLPVADIFAYSQLAGARPQAIAADGLHPSAAAYTDWVKEFILPEALALWAR